MKRFALLFALPLSCAFAFASPASGYQDVNVDLGVSIEASAGDVNLNQLDWFGDIQPPTQVTPRLWRSGRPTQASLQTLWARGVRVIVDLETDPATIEAEAAMARKIGFTFLSYPTDSFWSPDDKKIDEILTLLRTSKDPVLVHCYHRQDRTGLIVGLERVFLEKWPAAKAYNEMLSRGFHQILLGLDGYFRTKTGSW